MQLTIITPTYNRVRTLERCYQSLCAQTNKDFVWMIVDDGSTDDTQAWVQTKVATGDLTIQYFYKSNGGKGTALNLALDHLTTPYAVCLDSDDIFFPHAVEQALDLLATIVTDSDYCGVIALKSWLDGKVTGDKKLPAQVTAVTAADIFLKYCPRAEVTCFYKTQYLQKQRFPIFPGETMISPAWMQYTVSQTRRFKVCHGQVCGCEYQADGTTNNIRRIIMQNPYSYVAVKRFSFNLSSTWSQRIKHGLCFTYGCLLAQDRSLLQTSQHTLLVYILLPVAKALYWSRTRKEKG
ncbi:glycosyltransferase family A protein [Ligilactobacillus saerimneri]|uniref:glycosyltransferase family A protein n=1 Tax=Ligilactobacillus saerimneri TaxID=228229 RepID=UPI0024B1EB98|nr:glycosyltransferase family A protein [Ligilactobacillus saerimneri]MDI9205535.1 glycosyltransferase family A protein [Ligilactobacillus saerimneri]